MKLTVIAVGKLKEKYLKEGINEYSKRLSRFCELEIIEVNDEQAPDSLSSVQEEQVKKKEAERVIKRLKPGTVLIIMDVHGKNWVLRILPTGSILFSFRVNHTLHLLLEGRWESTKSFWGWQT